MKLIRQDWDSTICGQCCVAMVAGVSLEKSIETFGHSGPTNTRQVIKALRALGVQCADRLTTKRQWADKAILSFTHPDGKQKHWVVWHKNKYYDPVAGVHREVPNYLQQSRVTSHLPIYDA